MAGGEEATEDEKMFGWHHKLNGREFEQTPGDSERQGSVACCSPWGHKESDTIEQLNNTTKSPKLSIIKFTCVPYRKFGKQTNTMK